MKIDHIAIAVENLDRAVDLYCKLLGRKAPDEIEVVPSENVRVAIFNLGESAIELVSPTSDQSPIKRFLEKRGGGIHHVALKVDDIEASHKKLSSSFKFIGGISAGSRDTKICFVHPKSTEGVLIELVE